MQEPFQTWKKLHASTCSIIAVAGATMHARFLPYSTENMRMNSVGARRIPLHASWFGTMTRRNCETKGLPRAQQNTWKSAEADVDIWHSLEDSIHLRQLLAKRPLLRCFRETTQQKWARALAASFAPSTRFQTKLLRSTLGDSDRDARPPGVNKFGMHKKFQRNTRHTLSGRAKSVSRIEHWNAAKRGGNPETVEGLHNQLHKPNAQEPSVQRCEIFASIVAKLTLRFHPGGNSTRLLHEAGPCCCALQKWYNWPRPNTSPFDGTEQRSEHPFPRHTPGKDKTRTLIGIATSIHTGDNCPCGQQRHPKTLFHGARMFPDIVSANTAKTAEITTFH